MILERTPPKLWTPPPLEVIDPLLCAPPFGTGPGRGRPSIIMGGWSPLQYTGLVVYFNGTSLVKDPGDTTKVISWTDLSSNAHNTANASTTQRPTYTASAINGQPGATFDGSANNLRSAGSNTMPALGDLTVFVVAKPAATSAGTQYGMISLGAFSPAFGTYGSNPFYTNSSPFAFNSFSDKTVSAGTAYLFEFKRTNTPSAAWNCYLDNSLSTQTYTTSYTTSPQNWGYGDEGPGGGGHSFNGDICEIVVLDHTASSAEETLMHTYSQGQYGTA